MKRLRIFLLFLTIILILIKPSNSIACAPDHYDSNGVCQPCHITCQTCDGPTGSNCLSCELSTRQFESVGGTCNCKDGYKQSTTVAADCQVLVCHHSCQNCKTTETFCTSCQGNTRTLNAVAGTCNCNTKMFDSGTAICDQCDYTCQQCSGSATTCTQCDSSKYRTLVAPACNCMDKYFNVNNNEQCSPCDYKCVTCTTSASICDTCQPNRGSAPVCACTDSFYDDGVSASCLSCHYSCKTCTNYTACTSCESQASVYRGLVLTEISTYCQCLDGYFEDKSTPTLNCQSCHLSCLQCTNELATGCSACNITANRRLTSTSCICADGFYETASTVQHCQRCNSRCRTCVTSSSNCLTCSSSLFRVTDGAGNCPCTQGYYQATNTLLCVLCHSSCKSCTNSTQCATCDTTVKLYVLNSSNLCSCPIGKYFNTTNGQCLTCPYNCLSCSSVNVCLSCGANRSLTNTGTCPCILFHYDDGSSSQCFPCHYTCRTCNGLTDANCLNCNSFEFRTLSAGKCNCQDGYYDDAAKICKKCYYSCKTCTAPAMCSTCQNTLFRTDPTNNCPCLSNYYQNITTLTCTACAYHCLTCLDSVTCQTCSASRIRNPLTLKCQCPAQQYQIAPSQSCFPCLYDCKSCTNSSQCLTCDATLYRVMKSTINRCLCIDKYFEDSNNLCVGCDYDCKTCGASGSCLTCNQTANRIHDTGTGKCVCSIGYYDDAVEQCKKCSYACKQCTTNSMNCISCDTTLRTLNNFWCECPIQKYDNNITKLCPQCHYTCQSCQDYQYCQGCDISKFRTFDSLNVKCKCLDKYYDDLSTQLCKSCSYTCMTCTNATQCKTCDVTKFRQSPSLLCPCINKYYDDTLSNQLCVACHYSCKTCTNGTECKTCDTVGAYRIYDSVSKLCICQIGYYNSGTNEVCLKCDYKCNTCSTSATHCLTCNTPVTFRQFNTNTCPCKSRYYDGNLDAICQRCQYTCQTCLNALTCTTCDVTKKRTINSTSGLCNCLQGYYDNNSTQTCPQCHLTCKSCKTSLSCQICDPVRFRLLNSTANYLGVSSNYCVCFYRYYSPGNELSCLPCHYSCQVCTAGNRDNCIVCNAAGQRYYNSTSSKCLCNNGYYDDNTIEQCQLCHISCATCIGPLNTQCYTCNGTTFLMLNQTTCYINCPDYHYNKLSNHVCTLCSSNCLHCTDSNTCTQCESSYYLLLTDKKCYAVCPDGWYENIPTKSCLLCPVGCKTCDSNIKCYNCIEHYYFDNSLQICFQCNQFCKDCIGPGQDQCTSCYQPMYFKSNKCHDLICPYGQYIDSTLGCLKCTTSFPNSLTCNKTIPFLCIDTYKIYNNKCQKCNNVPGYHLSKLSNTCSQICGDGKLYDYQCDDGNLLNGDGCANNCMIEDGWQCTIGNVAGKSTCVLQKQLNMNIIQIYKYPGKNMVKLHFALNIPYRLLNKFVVTVQGVDSKYYNWKINQYNNMSQVYFDFTYTHHLKNKMVSISYDQSLSRRLLQTGTAINIQFSTSIPLESFPPLLYYPQDQLLQYSTLQQLIYYLSLILLILSLMSLLVFKKMHLHGLSFIHIPAKIYLIFGLAIGNRTDWINYLLKEIKLFGLIDGISSNIYNYIAGQQYQSNNNFTLINQYHSYTTQLINNSLYVILSFVFIYIITLIITFYHTYIKPIHKTLIYCQYYFISIHLLINFHIVYSSVNVLYHYKIQSKEEAFNVTLAIIIVLVNIAIGLVTWIAAKKMKLKSNQQYNNNNNKNNNKNKLEYLQVKNIDKTIDIEEDKNIQTTHQYVNNQQNKQNTLQKQFSLISRDQQQQQQQQSSQQANNGSIKQLKQEKINYQSYLNQSNIIKSTPLYQEKLILHFDYISLYNSAYKLSKYYLPVTFTFLYIQSLLICLLQQINPFYFIIIEGSLQLCYFMYILILRPFKSIFTNLRILCVQLMYLSLFTITGYYLYRQQQNVISGVQAEKIFGYLLIGLLIISILTCLLQHLLAWRQQIWSIIQPCLISLRLRGTKKVYDNPQKHQKQQTSNEQIKQQTVTTNQQYDIFYARVLNKEKVNKKYRKERMIKNKLYQLTN